MARSGLHKIFPWILTVNMATPTCRSRWSLTNRNLLLSLDLDTCLLPRVLLRFNSSSAFFVDQAALRKELFYTPVIPQSLDDAHKPLQARKLSHLLSYITPKTNTTAEDLVPLTPKVKAPWGTWWPFNSRVISVPSQNIGLHRGYFQGVLLQASSVDV